ncbi:unnamed protein product [Caenorhabditis sp. 36 PRJEB53466]|nr:unnamed protein product [Caenorhabditis sp. 36 PRJEB53466]
MRISTVDQNRCFYTPVLSSIKGDGEKCRSKVLRMALSNKQYSRLDEAMAPPRSLFKTIVFLVFVGCSFLFIHTLMSRSGDRENGQELASPTFKEFYECVYPKLYPLKGNYEEFWYSFVNLTKECDNLDALKALDIRPVENTDEVKYVAYPKKDEDITMVTLGVGHDVDAEVKLKELYPKTEFFGVDPIGEGNKDIYERKLNGTFFQIAVSGSGGMFKSHVFRKGYGNEMTMHIGAGYFFGEMLRKPKIDVLWIDTEGHEYTVLELLHRGGEFEKRGVKVCQMNVEMHKDTYKESQGEKQKFHDFVWKVLEDGKYVMLKPFFVSWRNKGFIRTFIVNVADKQCTDFRLGHPSNRAFALLLAALLCSFWLSISFLQDNALIEVRTASPIFQAYNECVYPKLEPFKGNYEQFWHSFVNSTKECDDLDALNALDIRVVENRDEAKYVAFPKKNEAITMVTLGIGHDVSAEIKLKELYPNTEFHGIDPIDEGNRDLYQDNLGGSFYQVAASGSSGIYKSFVFRVASEKYSKGYRDEMTMHIGAGYFFGEMLRKPKIDVLWIDTEGHEYTVLELLHRGGEFEKRGVKVCQMNVEMHKDLHEESQGEKQKFHDFVWKVLEDGKYVMLKPFFVSSYKGFIRTFIVNVADKECTDLYLTPE